MQSCGRQQRLCPETTTLRSPRPSGGSGRLGPGRVSGGPKDKGFWACCVAGVAELPGGEGTCLGQGAGRVRRGQGWC